MARDAISRLAQEASFLLFVYGPRKCPDWKEGVGDCHKPTCKACRVIRCIDALDDLVWEREDGERVGEKSDTFYHEKEQSRES